MRETMPIRQRSLLSKLGSLVLSRTVRRFVALELGAVRGTQARVPMAVVRYDREHQCPDEVLVRIKGKSVDWASRWKRGHVCHVACVDKEPVGYAWICHGEWRLRDGDRGRPLPPGGAFLYDLLTCAPWRGNGIAPSLISEAVRELIAQGHEMLYMIVADHNRESRCCAEKLGFTPMPHRIRTYRLFRIFRFRRDNVDLLATGPVGSRS